MKTELKETTKFEYVYIADDGTEFYNQEDCEKYEKTYEGIINKKFMAIVKKTFMHKEYGLVDFMFDNESENAEYYLVEPKTEADVNAIIQKVELCEPAWGCEGTLNLDMKDIVPNKMYIIGVSDFWSSVYSFENTKKYYLNKLDELSKIYYPSPAEENTKETK